MSDLTEIIRAHSDAVWRAAYRLLGHREDALDCYQETFLAALQLARKGEIRHWRTLLVRIATRRAIDRLRQRYQSEQRLDNVDPTLLDRGPLETPDVRVQGEELQEQVRRGLATLPSDQAEAFWLRHFEQLSVDEVAEQMGIESGHVRVLAHRAAVGLRTLLGRSFGPATISEDST
ncbi:MAG TPA: RNA polymerase sigma factor [Pirellulales bacterium]|jgi:RNA polymerase sigma-70 factor (ECF subfamily)|nr:RNA polymerase sigma factor [Pirellulales bacterium]